MTELNPQAGIETCIQRIESVVEHTLREYGENAYIMKDVHGRPLLGDMLASLGQLYAALVALKAKNGRTPSRLAGGSTSEQASR